MAIVHFIFIIFAVIALFIFSSICIESPASYALFLVFALIGVASNFIMKPLVKGNTWWRLFACAAYGFILYHLGKVAILAILSLFSGLTMEQLGNAFSSSSDAQSLLLFICSVMAVIRLTGQDTPIKAPTA